MRIDEIFCWKPIITKPQASVDSDLFLIIHGHVDDDTFDILIEFCFDFFCYFEFYLIKNLSNPLIEYQTLLSVVMVMFTCMCITNDTFRIIDNIFVHNFIINQTGSRVQRFVGFSGLLGFAVCGSSPRAELCISLTYRKQPFIKYIAKYIKLLTLHCKVYQTIETFP